MRIRIPLLAALVLGLLARGATALPLSVTETMDFEGNQVAPTHVGALDVGINVISGNVDQALELGGDSVAVDLPAGLSIVGIELELTNFVATAGTAASRVYVLAPFAPLEDQLPGADGTFVFGDAVPIASPDTYGLSNQVTGDGSGVSFDWVWRVTVVPEPHVAGLLAAALAAAAARRR